MNSMGSRGSGEMNSIMMEEDDPMDLGKPMSADEFRDRFDEGRDPGLDFYRHDSVQQLDDLEEVIAQALPRDRGAMERDTEREGMPLETVIPYDFDPTRDTIIIDIPRGYGAASGKTMEIKCHRFKPGAAVAIPVPKFTAAGRVARVSAVGHASDDGRTMGATEAEPAPSMSLTGTTGTTGTGSDDGDDGTAAKSVLASRAKSATRTTTVSQLYNGKGVRGDDFELGTPTEEDFKAEVTLMDELGRLIDGGEDSDSGDQGAVSGGDTAGGGESAQSGRRSEQEEDPSADGIWFTDKKVDADRRRDTNNDTNKIDSRGEAAAARGDPSTPGTDERSVSETRADMDEMGVPLDDLEGWVVDSPAEKDRLKKKNNKKKKLTWFFGKSSGWGFFRSGKKGDLDAQGLHLNESALEKMEKSGRGDAPSSRRASIDEPRRNSFDGNRRRSGEWQRPDPWSGMMPRAGQPPSKRSSGKSIVSLASSGGSIESLKEALAARQNSFGLVQRADSMTVPNGTGGRAFKVVACQGLTVQDDHAWVHEGDDQDEQHQDEHQRARSPDRVARPSQVDSNGRRRSSLDSESGDESGPVVMPRSNYVQRMERKERRETSAGGDGSAMRRRTGRAVDKKNVPGVLYLDDMPFAEGGFAKVYRGAFNNDGLSIAVAIKQMTYSLPEGETPTSLKFSRDLVTSRDERTPADRARDKLRGMGRTATREVEISKLCTHRNVVSHIMDHTGPSTDPADIAETTAREDGETDDEPSLGNVSRWKTYIITEFCIGGSLRDILRQPELVAATKQVRSSAAQLCVLKQVVEGMKYLHSIGVVHNDLKASNVLLHPSSETNCRWSAKIGDFGIARRIPPGHARVPLDVMNGTVSHMAPELLNDKFISRATDVYSFAVLLWEVAAQGETPFSGIDAVDVIAAVVKHDLRPKFAENAFRPLVQLATRCWHADPNKRPSFERIGVDLCAWEPLVTFQRVENVTYMPIREGQELTGQMSGADATLTEGIDDNDVTNLSQASSEMPLSTASVESLEAHARELRIAGGE